MSLNGRDDGLRARKEGPLSQHKQDIPSEARESREAVTDATLQDVVPELPKGMGVHETLQWVGGDKRRAQVALNAENKGGGARTTLVHDLERILNEETGAGIASGEA